MDAGQPRPGIFGSFASSIINVLQPLVAGHQDGPQPDRHAHESQGPVETPATSGLVPNRLPDAPSSVGEPHPSRSIPGRWDSVDYADVATVGRGAIETPQIPMTSATHVTVTEDPSDYSAPELLRQVEQYGDSNLFNKNTTYAFPEPHISPQVEVTPEPHPGVQAHSSPDPAALTVGLPSTSHSPPPYLVEQATKDNFRKGNEPFVNLPQQLDPTQTSLLKAPVTSGRNRSQDRLSISSSGSASVNSPEKKGLSRLLGSAKTIFKSPPPTPPTSRLEPSSVTPPGRLRSVIATEKQDALSNALDPKFEYFQNVELHSSTTWEDICAELMPLPAFSQILSHLHRVFGAVNNIKTYRGQWRRLRGNCVVASRLLIHQYERYQAEPERFQLLNNVCNDLGIVIAKVSITAQKWSEKNPVEAFVCYELMERSLRIHFQSLNDVIQTMMSTSQLLNETWTSEIAKHQREEREQIEMIHALLKEQNATLAQLAQAIQSKDDLIARLIGENEMTIGRFLGQQMAQFQQAPGDAEDIDKLIQTIVQITGVQLPTEVFQTEYCTNIPDVEPIHGHSSTVYKARLSRGQLVAKKVFYLNKYSEGDVKTYALKMTRDAKQWRVFDSEYTLKCLGIGMERTNGTQFKLQVYLFPFNAKFWLKSSGSYMLSPWMDNMDSLKYLKDRRKIIDRRNILRIVADSALGLVEIHRKHSVHSNMRAQNVFVRANGRGVLGGFGLTKALKNHATGKLPSVEQTGQALPYRWMAPECHNFGPGSPDVTVANDVWGWAMTALEASIITGAPPIRRIQGDIALPCAKIEEFDMAKQRDEYPEWEQYAHKPDLLWSLLSRCWNLDETKRPDMQTISDEIEKIIAQS